MFKVFIAFFIFSLLIILIDYIETLRNFSDDGASFNFIMKLVLLKFPLIFSKAVAFIIFFAAIFTIIKIASHSELIVMRASGISIGGILAPLIFGGFVIGVIFLLVINPVSSVMISEYQKQEAKISQKKRGLFDVFSNNLWLRKIYDDKLQAGNNANNNAKGNSEDGGNSGGDFKELIIFAKNIQKTSQGTLTKGLKSFQDKVSIFLQENNKDFASQDLLQLEIVKLGEVTIFKLENNQFKGRIFAEEGLLAAGLLFLQGGVEIDQNAKITDFDEYTIETNMTLEDIEKSLALPETISFLDLPKVIAKLKSSGFSSVSHQLHLHNLFAMPFFLASMVMVAGVFSVGFNKRDAKSRLNLVFGILACFIIYFLSNIIYSLGLTGVFNIIIASWLPVILIMLISVWFLLDKEDCN